MRAELGEFLLIVADVHNKSGTRRKILTVTTIDFNSELVVNSCTHCLRKDSLFLMIYQG